MSMQEQQDRIEQQHEPMRTRGGIEVTPEREEQQQFWDHQRQQFSAMYPETNRNVGPDERTISIAAGAIVGLLGLSRGTLPGLLTAGVGAALVYRGVTGECPLYRKMGITTMPHDGAEGGSQEHGIEVATAVLINKPAEELYRFWRNLENLPRFMGYLNSIRILDEKRSHWVAKAPNLAGGKVEWDAEITRDDVNELIAWRSLAGSTIDTAGQVRFQKAPGDRGTEVHVWMSYYPPAGRLGHWVASLLGDNPRRIVREELHNFRRLMELGEVPTIVGQPSGTCLGRGKRTADPRWKPLFT